MHQPKMVRGLSLIDPLSAMRSVSRRRSISPIRYKAPGIVPEAGPGERTCYDLMKGRIVMNSHRRFTRMGLLLSGPLMLLMSIGPGFAITGDDYGPLYTSSQPIMEAQSVLKAEHYLPAAEPRTGKMDGPTVKALKDFQRDHFIPASGRLDQETMAQLATHEEVMKAARAEPTGTERGARAAYPRSEERRVGKEGRS